MRVDELMSAPVLTVPADRSPKQVGRFLVDHGIGCVPVVDGRGRLIGIVTEVDLLRQLGHRDPTRHLRRAGAEPVQPAPTTIGELMTAEVIAVPVDCDVADAARLMLDRNLTRLPVVTGEQVVGIVSRTDLVRLLVDDDAAIAREVQRRLADLPGTWTAQVDRGVLTLTANGRRDTDRLARTVAWGVPGVIGVHVKRRVASA